MSNEYPREAVPEAQANRSALSISLIIINAVMGVPIMILGSSIGREYGIGNAAIVIAMGCGLTAVLAALTAYAGVRTRFSTSLLAENAFGVEGAKFLNFAIALALLGWFAVEMGFIGELVQSSSKAAFDLAAPQWIGVVVASLLICIASIRGIEFISKAPLFFLPILTLLMIYLLIKALMHNVDYSPVISTSPAFGTGVSAIVGSYVVGCLIMPDYSRFIASANRAITATLASLGVIFGLVIMAYAYVGFNTGAPDPAAMLLALGVPAIVTLVLPLGLMLNGIMCLYSSSLATSTILRGMKFRWIIVLTAVLGAGLALLGVQSAFVEFLIILGYVFPPAIAVFSFEALFRSKTANTGKSFRYQNLGIWLLGSAVAVASQTLGVGLTMISALDGFLAAFVVCFSQLVVTGLCS